MSTTETKTNLTKTEFIKKSNLFKGTIAVCVVYGVVSLLLLLIVKFTDKGKILLEESNFPFAITFALGMLIIIIILIIRIATFKVSNIKPNLYDDMLCPDFWKLKETNKTDLEATRPENRIGKEYQCARETNGVGSNNIIVDKTATNKYEKQLAKFAETMGTNPNSSNPNKFTIPCNMIYPQYMSKIDNINNPDTPNEMRCAYAQQCGLTWSSICPDME